MGEVVDLGTQFAVNVNTDGTEVHVLDGEVEWHPYGAPSQRMQQGEAARLMQDGQAAHFAAATGDFVDPLAFREHLQARQESRSEHWQRRSQELQDDPRLVAYFQVAPTDLSARRLQNLAAAREETGSEGAVVAAAPAANRWGQAASALDFSPTGSRVRLSIPGEHRSLTLLCWVRINSLDRWYNSLFLTDGHDLHEPHWQIMDDGRLFFSVKKTGRLGPVQKGRRTSTSSIRHRSGRSRLSGQWLMIATVYDVDARQVTSLSQRREFSVRKRFPRNTSSSR